MNQMFKDKLFLVMLVLGLLTIVAAAGVVTMQRGNGGQENPYVDMQGQQEFLAEDMGPETPLAGVSDASEYDPQQMDILQPEGNTELALQEAQGDAYAVSDDSDFMTESGMQYAAEMNSEIQAQEVGVGFDAATALVLDFSETSKMLWPHRGNIVLDYSMDSTIYFPTLEQYKCNPGLVIQADVSEPVYAPANARVLENGMNEEIGNFVVLDLGNEYTAVCGQLKEVPVSEGEYLEKGQLLGYVAEPTKYYTIEGSNVFFELKHQNKAVDPLDYME